MVVGCGVLRRSRRATVSASDPMSNSRSCRDGRSIRAQARGAMSLRIQAASATDVGNVRESNQDSFLIVDGALFVVADGMGGHVAGEVASHETIEAMRATYPAPGSIEDFRQAVRQANAAIWKRGSEDPSFRGMGTTVTAVAVVDDDRLAVANVGDSRTYLLRDKQLLLLTRDHSFVQEAVRSGQLSRTQAEGHPRRSQLTRALGVEADVEVDVNPIEPVAGDRLLLCSDGLWDEVGDELIAMVLSGRTDPAEAASELVRWAKDAGGRDNITVIVLDVVQAAEGERVASTPPVVFRNLAVGRSIMQPGEQPSSNPMLSDATPPRPRMVTRRIAVVLALLVGVLTAIVLLVILSR